MANARLIKRRITSAKNISQITKAMELVAASKMKKAQIQAMAGKQYAQKIYEMVMRVTSKMENAEHPLLQRPKKPTGRKLLLFISTNKGLCGNLNGGLFRFTLRGAGDITQYDAVSVGKKGARFLVQMRVNILADFSETVPFSESTSAINDFIVSQYLTQKYDGVDIIYNEFFSALKQDPKVKTVLPLRIENISEGTVSLVKEDYVIEPNPRDVLNALLPHYLENQIRDALLQAEASEHSARMVAMRNATDNAKSLVYDLSLLYNKARQEKITYEIADMVTARLVV